jgi:cysteinyl-tRNA synthetase
LGLLKLAPVEFLQKPKNVPAELVEGQQAGLKLEISNEEVERLIAERREARARKNFKRSDEIRDQLVRCGIILEDKPDGTTSWRHS